MQFFRDKPMASFKAIKHAGMARSMWCRFDQSDNQSLQQTRFAQAGFLTRRVGAAELQRYAIRNRS